jgi:hypothetical protein
MSVDDFFSRLNPILVGILRSPLHWLVSPFLILVTVTGRRTGVDFDRKAGLGDPALAQMGREIAIVRFRVESSER